MRPGGGKWRWANVPIPRTHVLAIGLGLLLHRRVPWRIPLAGRRGRGLGVALVIIASVIVARSVRAAGTDSMHSPRRVISRGPYAYSRHPMYVAWVLCYLGIILIARTMWLLIALPGVVVVTRSTVQQEEEAMTDRFGREYRQYAARVPRYVSIRRSFLRANW